MYPSSYGPEWWLSLVSIGHALRRSEEKLIPSLELVNQGMIWIESNESEQLQVTTYTSCIRWYMLLIKYWSIMLILQPQVIIVWITSILNDLHNCWIFPLLAPIFTICDSYVLLWYYRLNKIQWYPWGWLSNSRLAMSFSSDLLNAWPMDTSDNHHSGPYDDGYTSANLNSACARCHHSWVINSDCLVSMVQ